jgi:hypothetical protein
VLPERQLAARAAAFDHANFSAGLRRGRTSGIHASNDVTEPGWRQKAPSGSQLSQIPEGARSSSPGLLESSPRRRLTMSEHREHLLPDAEDVACRGAVIVEPNADMEQRIYRQARSTRAVCGYKT